MELTATFMALLDALKPVFTTPSFATFRLRMTGWILSVRHRYVTDLIVSSDSTRNGHFSDYHRFFSHAAWDIDQLWKLLATLIINTLIGKDGERKERERGQARESENGVRARKVSGKAPG